MAQAKQAPSQIPQDQKKGIIRILKESYDLFDHHLFSFIKIIAVVVVPLVIFHWVVFSLVLLPPFLNRVFDQEPVALLQCLGVILAAIGVTYLALSLYLIALYKALTAIEEGRKFKTMEVYRQARLLLPSYLRVVRLSGVKVFLWSMLLFVPGLVVGTWYSLAHIIFILEGKSGQEALKESKRIVQPHILKYLVDMGILVAILFIIFFIGDILLANTFGVNIQGDLNVLAGIGEVLFYIFIVVLSIFPLLFIYSLYKELKRRAVLAS